MRPAAGFTLLELLVVILILSLLAFGAVGLVEGDEDAIRFEETRGRLGRLRAAIVGARSDPDAAPGLSGYVADVGLLPPDLDALVRRPQDVDAFAVLAPVFDPDASVPEDEVVLDEAACLLAKGWRGPYLALAPSVDPATARFRDGWGTVSPLQDERHHGWKPFAVEDGVLVLASYGADRGPGTSGGTWDADLALALPASDWHVPLGGWAPEVENATASDLWLRPTVLVFEGRAPWTRRDGLRTKVPAGARAPLAFPATAGVPSGRHLLLLLEDADDVAGNGEVPWGAAPFLARVVSFSARAHPSPVLLEAR